MANYQEWILEPGDLSECNTLKNVFLWVHPIKLIVPFIVKVKYKTKSITNHDEKNDFDGCSYVGQCVSICLLNTQI